MNQQKLPYALTIYILALLSCFLWCFAGIGILPAIASFVLANKSLKVHKQYPDRYTNSKLIKKGRIMASIGIVINLIIIAIAIWTLLTIGWDAWSDEFVRKWNEGLEKGRG